MQLFKELLKRDSADYVGCLQPTAEDAAANGTPAANGTGGVMFAQCIPCHRSWSYCPAPECICQVLVLKPPGSASAGDGKAAGGTGTAGGSKGRRRAASTLVKQRSSRLKRQRQVNQRTGSFQFLLLLMLPTDTLVGIMGCLLIVAHRLRLCSFAIATDLSTFCPLRLTTARARAMMTTGQTLAALAGWRAAPGAHQHRDGSWRCDAPRSLCNCCHT